MSLVCFHDAGEFSNAPCCGKLVCSSCGSGRGRCMGCGAALIKLQDRKQTISAPALQTVNSAALFTGSIYPDFASFVPEIKATVSQQRQLASVAPPMQASSARLYPALASFPAPSAPAASAAITETTQATTVDDDGEHDETIVRAACPHGCGTFTRDELPNHIRLLHTDISDILKHAAALVSRSKENVAAKPDRPSPKDVLVHHVQYTDTLAGIALRYGVSVESVKRANRMLSDEIAAHKTLMIPGGQKPAKPIPPMPAAQLKRIERNQRERLHTIFCELTGCSSDEAAFYLDSNQWAYEKAMAQYREDRAWHIEQKIQRNKKRGTCHVQ